MDMGGSTGIGNLGGSADFAQKLLGQLGLGARTSQSVAAANSSNVQVNPTFVQTGSGSPSVSGSIGDASASPSASATSSAASQDPLRSTYNPSTLYRTTPVGSPTYDPLNQLGGNAGSGDLALPLLMGAGLLFLILQD